MDKPKMHSQQVSDKNKDLKGLQDNGQITFDCTVCGIPLLVLQIVSTKKQPTSNVLTRVAVYCEKCDVYSPVKQVSGQFYPGAPSDQMVFDVMDQDDHAPEADVFFKAWSK